MAEQNIAATETGDLVAELAKRAGVEHARLLDGMFTSLSVNGPVDLLMIKPVEEATDEAV